MGPLKGEGNIGNQYGSYAAELKDFLRADELAGLSMRFRAEFAKL